MLTRKIFSESFEKLATEYMTWHSLLILSTISNFRKSHPQLFNFRSEKVQQHLTKIVFPDCKSSIRGIPSTDEQRPGLKIISDKLFTNY